MAKPDFTIFVEGSEYELGALVKEVERLRAIVGKLPKCWRLVDGELVQDVPVVPDMNVYGETISGGTRCWTVELTVNGGWKLRWEAIAASPEAAEALKARE